MNKRFLTIGVILALALAQPPVRPAQAATYTVNSANDVNDGVCNATHCSLREAIIAATFWTSGWTPINQGQTLTFNHDLGAPPEQLAVELWFKDTDPGGIGIHRANYGGLEIEGSPSAWHGAFWRGLTANTISVRRMPDDITVDEINVKVWMASPPDHDSGWQTIAPGQLNIDHNLGVTNTELIVSMWFSGTVGGINHFTYGGLTSGLNALGAYWYRLADNQVRVYRRADDPNIAQVRVVVNHSAPPAYDSLVTEGGWMTVTAGSEFVFNHNLNWNPDMLLVQAECNDPGGAGIHQMFAGGDEWSGSFRGAHLQKLTTNTVTFVRQPNDTACSQARVIIHKRSVSLYLPLVMRQ